MEINKAIYNFTYSFLPVAGENSYDKDVLESFIKSGNGNWGKPDKNVIQSRKGLSSYLNLDLIGSMGYEILDEIKGLIYGLEVTILPIFRYFSFGASLTFHIVVVKEIDSNKFLDINKLYSILQIVSTEKNRPSNLSIEIKLSDNSYIEKSLYNLFIDLVASKITEVNTFNCYKYLQESLKVQLDSNTVPFEHNKELLDYNYETLSALSENLFKYINENIQGQSDKFSKSELYDYYKVNIITLLCQRYLSKSKEKEVNVPWITIAFELAENKKAYKAFCGVNKTNYRNKSIKRKKKKISKYENKIAPFLYRAIDNSFTDYKLEPCYDNYTTKRHFDGFENMYVDSRLYLHLSRRTILLLTNDFNKKPGNYILPVINDLCEITHTRWQSLIILNRMLDVEIKRFANHKYDLLNPNEKIKIIIQMVKKSIFTLEDPTSYVLSGDSLREIHDTLKNTFKLMELHNSVTKKIEMLEKLNSFGIKINV